MKDERVMVMVDVRFWGERRILILRISHQHFRGSICHHQRRQQTSIHPFDRYGHEGWPFDTLDISEKRGWHKQILAKRDFPKTQSSTALEENIGFFPLKKLLGSLNIEYNISMDGPQIYYGLYIYSS